MIDMTSCHAHASALRSPLAPSRGVRVIHTLQVLILEQLVFFVVAAALKATSARLRLALTSKTASLDEGVLVDKSMGV